MPDAVVIGAGPNGLVAANLLADRGWSVTVFEAAPDPGGAVRSAELMEPGFVNDLFSAFYPFAHVSPGNAGCWCVYCQYGCITAVGPWLTRFLQRFSGA